MLEIPGYRWDEATKRYYKDDRRAPGPAASARAKQRKNKPSKRDSIDTKLATGASGGKTGRRTGAQRDACTPVHELLDVVARQPFSEQVQAQLKERSLIATFGSLKRARTEQPNLSQGDTITCFEFDKENADIIRYGTSAGLIGRGSCSGNRTQSHSTDQWAMEHILGAPISSVHMDQGFIVGTSLGPIAQAVFGRTDSPSHVKFAPRQTSLWSSSIWRTQVALGCDKKVLYARNPADQAFQSFGTGSAVFALDHHEEELFVGTRSGHVRLFDVRQRTGGEAVTPPQVLVRLHSPVTHIRRVSDRTFLVAQMDGTLERYDSRWLKYRSEPVTRYAGHVNTQSRALGLDVWNEQILAAAGEDGTVRKWIISNGRNIAGSIPNILHAPAEDSAFPGLPIQFQPNWPAKKGLWISSGRAFQEYTDKSP